MFITHDNMIAEGWIFDPKDHTYHKNNKTVTAEMIENKNGKLMEIILKLLERR